MAPSNSPDGRDMVKLRAVFVPDGQTAPAELIAGMVDIVRLSVDLLPDDGGPTDGSDGGIPRPTPERRGQTT